MPNPCAFWLGVLLLGAGLFPASAADFEVSNTEDSGFGTLRQAIADADDNPGADRIVFNIAGDGVQTIRPLTMLPALAHVEVDGYTQPGSSVNTFTNGFNGVLLIQLDGVNIQNASTGLALQGSAKLRGLVINRFTIGISITSESNVVAGNFVGLDPSGRTALGNIEGIWARDDLDSMVGGPAPSDRNVVGGNASHSMQLGELTFPGAPSGSTNLSVLNNYFGTDASGRYPMPTNQFATTLSIRLGTGLILGGLEPGSGNVIAVGNTALNMYGTFRGAEILGNLIGVGVDGGSLRHTNTGVGIQASTDLRFEQNTVAFTRIGVNVYGNNVTILSNRIYSNTYGGILFGDISPTNDVLDLDTGINDQQNYPTLTATAEGNEIALNGQLGSKPDTHYIVQLFASGPPNTNGLCEGEQILDTIELTTDAAGLAAFASRYPSPGPPWSWLTATATDPEGNTSTFSPGALIRSPTSLVVHQQPQSITVSNGATVTFRAVISGATPIAMQWRRNGQDLSGETNDFITLRNVKPVQGGAYHLVASNAFGTVATLPAQLTFIVPATFVLQPLSQTVAPGEWVTLSVGMSEFTTPPIGFRWRSNGVFQPALVGSNYNSFIRFLAGPASSSWSVVVTSLVTRSGIGSSTAAITVAADRDHDGLPDAYETQFNLDPDNPGDAGLDPDGDGLTTAQEYLAGTNPRSAVSQLRFDQVRRRAGPTTLEFQASSNKTYRIEFTDQLGAGTWYPLLVLPARRTNTTMTVSDPTAEGGRFYRMRTPSDF